MNRAMGMAAIGVIAAAAVTGCGGGEKPVAAPPVTVTATATVTATVKPSPVEADCRAAIRVDYENGWADKSDPYPPSTRKPVCAGFDRPTLQRLMDEAIADITNGTPGPG